jgi:cell division GTPase FtsZ
MNAISRILSRQKHNDKRLMKFSDSKQSEDLKQIPEQDILTPMLKFTEDLGLPQIPIICVGGAGINLGKSIMTRFNQYSLEYEIAAIDLDKENLEKNSAEFASQLNFGETGLGTSKQFRLGTKVAIDNKDKIEEFVSSYLNEFHIRTPHEIVFILLGAGGTGVGVTLELIKILKGMGKRPVPIFLLPFASEQTRIRFTAAAALYHFSYAPGDRSEKLQTIVVDNEEFYLQNTKLSHDKLIEGINSRVGAIIADLIVSTEIDSAGYSTDLNEFVEVFRTIKGLGCFSYISAQPDARSLSNIFDNNNPLCNSFNVDPYSSVRSYTFIQAGKGTISSEGYRDFYSNFGNSDIFPRLSLFDKFRQIEIRGVYAGVKISDKIKKLMVEAEDVRVRQLKKQIDTSKEGNINLKLDQLDDGEEIEVETAAEIREKLSEESAASRRGE